MSTETAKVVFVARDELYADWYGCQRCGCEDVLRRFHFCPHCGRVLDWTGVD